MELVTPGIGLIFWQTITFLLVLFFLGKFAWKPILGALKNREESIELALKSAESAKEEIVKLKLDNEKLFSEAREERDKIMKEAMTVADTMKEEAKRETSKITAKMIIDAKASINAEKKAALTEVRNQVASISLEIAEKILRKNLAEDKSQQELLNKYMKDLRLN